MHRAVALGVIVASLVAAGSASGAPPRLTVAELGQPGIPPDPSVVPVTVSARDASCAVPLTLESTCSPTAWPKLGGSWGPIVGVAGGDLLRFSFSGAVNDVIVASTTNLRFANADMVTPIHAAQAGSPTTWVVTLPILDRRSITPLTFSVVATDAAGSHDYALMILSPRPTDMSGDCWVANYNTGDSQRLCTPSRRAVPQPGLGPVKSRPRSDGSITISLQVRRPGTLSAKATFDGSKLRPYGRARRGVDSAKLVRLTIHPRRAAIRALRRRGRLAVAIALRLSEPSGALTTANSRVVVRHR